MTDTIKCLLITSMIVNFYLLYGYMSFFYDFPFHYAISEFPSFPFLLKSKLIVGLRETRQRAIYAKKPQSLRGYSR